MAAVAVYVGFKAAAEREALSIGFGHQGPGSFGVLVSEVTLAGPEPGAFVAENSQMLTDLR